MGTSEPVFSLNFLDLIFYFFITPLVGFPWWFNGKESACLCRRHRRCSFDSWVEKIPWRRKWHPLHYSCLGNPMDRGTWRAIICRCHKRVKHDLATKQQHRLTKCSEKPDAKATTSAESAQKTPKKAWYQKRVNRTQNRKNILVRGRVWIQAWKPKKAWLIWET